MIPLFDGIELFGGQTQEDGPRVNRRDQRHFRPGVPGFKIYRLGSTSYVWTVRGLIQRETLEDLESAILAGANYQDGLLYDFTTSAGTVFNFCTLTDYRPTSPIIPVFAQIGGTGLVREGFIRWVSGTVEWTAPNG